MGFRGEALASMTYVAHVTVTTITKGKLHGYRCWWYLLSDSGDDYSKIVDLLSRFAIHHMNVSSSCRKHGAARADANSVPQHQGLMQFDRCTWCLLLAI
ncbi:hypothetical protein FF1_008512 [Malus domestica]